MTMVEASPTATDEVNVNVPAIDYALCDADEHYYEAEDALTRYLDPKYRRAVRWIEMGGRKTLLINDRLVTVVPNPTYDPVGVPGSIETYFRAQNHEGKELRDMMKMHPIQPEYRDRDARVAKLDEFGVQLTWMLPSLGLGVEELLWTGEPEVAMAVLSAYNKWVNDDWGFDRDGRIMTGPLISLLDADLAEAEVDAALAIGTRMIVMRPAPVMIPGRHRSPADPRYDRIWAKLAEAGVVVAIHAADSGYTKLMADWGESPVYTGVKQSALTEVLSIGIERPIYDMIAAMVCHGLFDRHPTLKVAALELGSQWVPSLHRNFKRAYGKSPQDFKRDPQESFREHVWVAPFYEDDITVLRDCHSADRILLGSDWPHPEGLASPKSWIPDFVALGETDMKKALRTNLLELSNC
jgi:predicted TIM-barrel fold metal-dependent hydrolase